MHKFVVKIPYKALLRALRPFFKAGGGMMSDLDEKRMETDRTSLPHCLHTSETRDTLRNFQRAQTTKLEKSSK